MLPDVFGALANPARRRMLDALRAGPLTAGELTGLLALSRSAASEHLAVLREAGLVREERRGRNRVYHLQPERLSQAGDWLKPYEQYWNRRLDVLGDLLDATAAARPTGHHAPHRDTPAHAPSSPPHRTDR
ncbi:ArsR/SmtB family transcription factor [Arthrobacter woluwensis]|uniref:ArsR/SmtB family transcription factor n=1 Tax=Arthrobacter woluwensis TaxID=156980 RepID=UPI001AAF77B1|nr:metalloregulator ArsR/SmtB family transcription factor [Arthrobacter woluwensis]QTF73054.1 winged helix-turn-helix transcriptional regulator [Arthrobacter woluwensis]